MGGRVAVMDGLLASNSTYFATLSGRELGRALLDRVDRFYRYVAASGSFIKARKSYRARYGLSSNGSLASAHEVAHGGEAGELSFLKVNHLGNLSTHLLTLATAQRPAAKPIASNTDSKSYSQVVLASGLLDYYAREKRAERVLKEAADIAIMCAEGWVATTWDATEGEEYERNPETGQAVRQGDLRFDAFTPLDIIRDSTKTSSRNHDWLITREFRSRFEVAAQYPHAAEGVLKLSTSPWSEQRLFLKGQEFTDDTEDVALYTFYHRVSSACPQGRLVVFCQDGTILFEGPLPYRRVPVRRIAPADIIGTPQGYTPVFDLLALQEAVDALYSIVLTNQTTFGVQNICVPDTSDITYEELSAGLNLIRHGRDGKPEVLELLKTPAEIFGFIKQLEEAMETLSGINSTVRGNPEASLKSGSALALVQAQAIQFSSGLQLSYAQLIEDVFTDALDALKDYATTRRVALIVGQYQQHMLKDFTGEDISNISRVVVDAGSSLEKTASGRIQMAQDLLNSKLISHPEQYLAVVTTGKLEPMTEAETRELSCLRKENEALSQGRPVRALVIDNHQMHIREHACVLMDPDLRERTPENEAVQKAVLEHVMEHMNILASAPPNLMALLGQQSLMVPPPTPEEAAGGTPAAPKGQKTGGPPKQPKLPDNPSTGAQWNPQDGGGAQEAAQANNAVPPS